MNEQIKIKLSEKPWFKSTIWSLIIILILALFTFWYTMMGQVKTEDASIVAPIINLSPINMGALEEVYVKVGDHVMPYAPIAKVGNEIITAKVEGDISVINNVPGQVFPAGSTVASMVNTNEARLVGQIDEDKGLADIKAGDLVTFTIDAFGSKKYVGIVEAVSPSAHQGDVVFSISDKREEKQFDVKVKFDIKKYPELKNGMSARLNIFEK